MIDSVFRTGKNYYLQVFLEELKYVVKETKIPKYIIDDIEISSDSDRENSILSKKTKKSFQKRLVKDIKIFLKKKKIKSANMLVSDIEIFLKKKKKRSVNMVVNDIKRF